MAAGLKRADGSPALACCGGPDWRHDPRSRSVVAAAILLGRRAAHPAAGLHGRAVVLRRAPGMALLAQRRARLSPPLGLLAEDFRDLVRAQRRLRARHAVP